MATNKRGTKIEQMEAELQKLKEAQQARKQKIDELEAEQRGHMVAARVRKDVGAQRSIDRLSDEIIAIRTANFQDCGAAEVLQSQIETERAELEREERRSKYGAVLLPIRARVESKLEDRLLKLALELKQLAEEISASDAEIAGALRGLGHSFDAAAHEVGYYLPERRAGAFAMLLRDVLQIPIITSGFGANQIPAVTTGLLAKVIKEIEAAA